VHLFERNALKSEPVEDDDALGAAMDKFERLFEESRSCDHSKAGSHAQLAKTAP